MADRLPEGRQHVDRVEAAAEEGQGRNDQHRNKVELLEIRRPHTDDEAEQAEAYGRQHEEQDHHERMGNRDIDEEGRRDQDDGTDHQTFGGRRSDITCQYLRHRDRGGENFIHGAGEFREIDAEGAVADALRQQGQHDEARCNEGPIGNALDLLDARADRGSEDDEIERCRDDRRDHALQKRAARACHFEEVDGLDGFEIHFCPPTNATKISSSELCRVEISLK